MRSPDPASSSVLAQAIQTIYLTFKLLMSSKVPMWTKLVPLLALAYVIFPMDFLPDFFPVLGQVDDLSVVLLLLWAFMQLVPKQVVSEVRGDDKMVDGEYKVLDDDHQAGPSGNVPPDSAR